MKIDNSLIKEIASLAKLEFNKETLQEIKKDLEKIIDFVDKLEELDTTNVEPLHHLNNELNILREDAIKTNVSKIDALKNAPKKDSDYFKVPTVLKK